MAKTIILKSIFIAFVALIFLVSLSRCDLLTKSSTNGFTTDLIHRDSPQSPSYDPSLSHSQRLVNAIRRSFNRFQRFNVKRATKSPEPDIINSGGEYLIKYSIGTPQVPSLGIADTGSDIIWTQCQPCLKCFKQNLPLFNPKSSSTYRAIPCNTTKCSLQETTCSKTRKNCLYYEGYGDGSFTEGLLSTDTFTLASTGGNRVSLPNIIFGCGFKNGGIFDGGESGIVGLGGGKASLVRQLGPLAQGKFSYCLVPSLDNKSNSSKLNFGDNARVSGRGVVSTPLVSKKPDTFYYVTLLGISVGNQKLEFYDKYSSLDFVQEGNIIVDSGTTLTLLPTNFYAKLKNALQSSIKLKQTNDPQGVLDLCFLTEKDIDIPKITVHFKGANVNWKQENVFVRTSEFSLCLAAQPVQDLAIFGNLAQTNFLVGFDLEKRLVSFKAADCGKL
ncbi:hypothetical protein DH2020_046969 [Rehmannia glutinosa]|uniref:Peptidase A1 domain-containing protein n=1 Tax=Rehmannia glutinosa TaxID=99300 RepID=A0ABR0UAD5_REHGL